METTKEDKKKAARKAYQKKYRAENAESIKDRGKRYYNENIYSIKERHKKYRIDKPESIKDSSKKYYLENSESIKEKDKKYRLEKAESIKDSSKKYYLKNVESIKDSSKKYYLKNVESIKQKHKKYKRNRRKNDPVFRMIHNMRNRLHSYFKSSNIKKTNKTFVYVGCTPECLMAYLETQFTEGMTRENYGYKGWHIDHIIPLSSAGSDKKRAEELCHYTNLQPLWWHENISKGNKC